MEKKRSIQALTKDIEVVIEAARVRCSMSKGDLIVRSGLGRNKFYSRKKELENLTLKECWALEDTLKLERGAIAGMK